MEEPAALIFDLGTEICKLGFAGECEPTRTIKTKQITNIEAQRFNRREGLMSDLDTVEELLNYSFDLMEVNSTGVPVLLTEPQLNANVNREKIVEIMFEKFQVPAFCLSKQPVLAMMAAGRSCGLVFESGESTSTCVPIIDNYSIPGAVESFGISGSTITNHLQKIYNCSYDQAQYVKEHLARVTYDPLRQHSTESDPPREFELPDGKKLMIDNEISKCTEIFFNPALFSLECQALHELLFAVVTKFEPPHRANFYGNVIFAGGNTLFPGLSDRIGKELFSLGSSTRLLPHLHICPERLYSVWQGGSILASLEQFNTHCMSSLDFHETGSNFLYRIFI